MRGILQQNSHANLCQIWCSHPSYIIFELYHLLDPVEGPKTNLKHLAKWKTGNKPSVLMMESLGSTQEGHQGSEKDVYKNVEKIISQATGRVVFGTFSSMLERSWDAFWAMVPLAPVASMVVPYQFL